MRSIFQTHTHCKLCNTVNRPEITQSDSFQCLFISFGYNNSFKSDKKGHQTIFSQLQIHCLVRR